MPGPHKPHRKGRRRRPPAAGPRGVTTFERARKTGEPPWLQTALDAIARHRASGEPLERALQSVMPSPRPSSADRRLIGDAVFGWARRRIDAEAAVDQVLKDRGGRTPSRRDRDAAAVLLTLLWAGEERAEASRHPMLALIDGLPAPTGAPSLQRWLADRLKALDDADALMAALAEQAPIGLATDPTQLAPQALSAALVEAGLDATPSTVSPFGVRVATRFAPALIPEAMQPHVWAMDEGSQRVALAVDAQPGERVLDLCAGGGGKAQALATTGCELVCVDVSRRRLAEARRRAPHATCVLADGRHPPFADASFDAVLIDAPCSGTGTLRRAPDLGARLTEERVADLTVLQGELLEAARRLVRPGGRLIYATCSLLPQENGELVGGWLGAHDDTTLVKEQTLRPDREGTDGFYVACLAARE